MRDEYIYRKKDTDRALALPPHLDMALEWSDLNRLWIYLGIFGAYFAYDLYNNVFLEYKQTSMEMGLLQ